MAQTATLTGLGTTFGAEALSRDGQVVVGLDETNNRAAYWTIGTVIDLNGLGAGSIAFSCNADGSVIVGETGSNLPFIWEKQGSSGVMQTLPLLNGTSVGVATLISADGSTVAGVCSGQPVVWTIAGVTALPGVAASSAINAISDDGSTIAGDLYGNYQNFSTNINAASSNFLYGQNSVLWQVGALGSNTTYAYPAPFNPYTPGGTEAAYQDIFCLTSDGSTGYGGNYNLYIDVDTMSDTYLPETSGFTAISATTTTSANIWDMSNFEVHSCNQDGSVLAGQAMSAITGHDANDLVELIEIDRDNAMIAFNGSPQDMKTFLTGLGASTSGWTLNDIPTQSMSADGTVILGYGTDPSNSPESWIATISPAVTKLDLGQGIFVGGTSFGALLYLNYPVGKSTTVAITSSNTAAVSNTTATVPQTSSATEFALYSSFVSSPVTVVLTASLGSSSTTAMVTINPCPLSNFYFAQATITGGNSTTGYLEMQGQAGPSGDVITLSFPNGSYGLGAAATVKIPAGSSNATFPVTSAAVSASASIPVKATLNGYSVTANVTVNPYAITGFTLSAETAVGGNAVTGSIKLAGKAGPNGDAVTLKSSNSVVTIPATVDVAAGGTTVTFSVVSKPVTAVTTATLTATLGSSTVTTIIDVIPATVSLVRIAPAPVVGGIGTKVAVYLNGKAPTAGEAVAVSCNSTYATFPTSITVPSGATDANASVTTSPVSAPTTVVVTAKTAAVSTETTFVINPAPLTSIKTTTATVVGGKATALTITLGGKAGPSGLIVQLYSSSTEIPVPATVVVPAGATSLVVNLTTVAVQSNASVTLTATTATSTAKYVVTLSP